MTKAERKAFEDVFNSLSDLIFLRERAVEKERLHTFTNVWKTAEERVEAAKKVLKVKK